jgi:hypothetical protein
MFRLGRRSLAATASWRQELGFGGALRTFLSDRLVTPAARAPGLVARLPAPRLSLSASASSPLPLVGLEVMLTSLCWALE